MGGILVNNVSDARQSNTFGFCFHNGRIDGRSDKPTDLIGVFVYEITVLRRKLGNALELFCRDRSYNGGFAGNFQKNLFG